MSVKNLTDIMRTHSVFEEEFEKELQSCYDDAIHLSSAGNDRGAAEKLAQAAVWKRLLKLSKYENT